MRSRYFRLAAVALALVGYWTPWLTHPAAALRLNGYELSEWITFLPAVRGGALALTRLHYFAPLLCLALLCGLVATRGPHPPTVPPLGPPSQAVSRSIRPASTLWPATVPHWGWLLVVFGAACALIVLPPYPYLLTAYADLEYQAQFFVALATLVALLVVLYLPVTLKDILQVVLGIAGAAFGAWALLAVRPAASAVLNAPWPIGIGWWGMLAGFAALALAGVAQLFGPRD